MIAINNEITVSDDIWDYPDLNCFLNVVLYGNMIRDKVLVGFSFHIIWSVDD